MPKDKISFYEQLKLSGLHGGGGGKQPKRLYVYYGADGKVYSGTEGKVYANKKGAVTNA